jgi:hypothetical protein
LRWANGGHPVQGLDLLLQPGGQFEGEDSCGGVAALDEAFPQADYCLWVARSPAPGAHDMEKTGNY